MDRLIFYYIRFVCDCNFCSGDRTWLL